MNALPNANQALWEKGDFTRIADYMRDSGEALVRAIGVLPGFSVLDLGCGDGTTAIPAAQMGANVLGVDIARNLVAAGNSRAASLGLRHCRFEQGDARNLSAIGDDSFDLVISIFCAMFAPDPVSVAQEMVRVTRPGGRIVMGNWIPGDPTLIAQILKISAAYSPPTPVGFVSPMSWGDVDEVRARFTAAGIPARNIAFQKDAYVFKHRGSPRDFLATMRSYYGPMMNAFAAAETSGKADELQGALETLFDSQNVSGQADETLIRANFLRVTVSVP
ncbi:MAG TPA: class I SAM-dependent methyltransferase [Micropepsaceae bacterium]|nr:class I SAM-dependent methyltransferase [Micropepsaceae bacterium]